ncbi:hypothetical protein B0H15DRAFT_780046 [Mycena belliarum]|uniref:Uncharacterized protein n=1 Tax=Mycena belliarum TaxID=1033014 RepID=A0AAD6U3N2_9AGAR|nr:hypothetical protein B0H15DRAFT_780046 [Mycena belliae]
MNSTVSTTKTPLGRLAVHSTATCSIQATAYGKCILATYTDVTKDVCKEEFTKFATCLRQAVCHSSLRSLPLAQLDGLYQMGRKW